MFFLENIKYKNIIGIESLEIPASFVSCIIGESGSGKTTLLKLLNHLISPDSGTVYYKGFDLEAVDPVEHRRKVVMLPQSPIIFPGNIKENLLTGLRFCGKNLPNDNNLKEIMESVKLKKDLSADTVNLSGGEKQRLAVCRIMLMDPEVFIMDEPTSSLDDDTGDILMIMVTDFCRRYDKTLITVTHSRLLAEKYGDQVITLSNGSLAGVQKAVNNYG